MKTLKKTDNSVQNNLKKQAKVNKKPAKQEVDIAKKRFVLSDETPFQAKEAYKALRTNVMFSMPGSESKCVGVTSSVPSEGKSTTAINLAISLAQIGKKVLLVDADMRIPSVAGRMKIKGVPGLSDFLVGEAKIEDAVRNVEEYGIHVLPAGSIPPDPTGLLEAKHIEHLFSAVRSIYDFVIVDLPPVNSVPDAVILAKHIDGYLLAVREKVTKHKEIVEALKHLQLANANIVGFVSNGGVRDKGRYNGRYRRSYHRSYQRQETSNEE